MKTYKNKLQPLAIILLIIASIIFLYILSDLFTFGAYELTFVKFVFLLMTFIPGILVFNHKVLVFTNDYIMYREKVYSSSVKILYKNIIDTTVKALSEGSCIDLTLNNGAILRVNISLINHKYIPEILYFFKIEIKNRNLNSGTTLKKKTCPNCKKEILETDTFCRDCGHKLEQKKICPNCKKEITDIETFCRDCGQKLK